MARCYLKWSFIFLLIQLAGTGNSQTFNGQAPLPVPPGAPSMTVGITTSIATVSGIGVLGSGCSFIDHVTLDLTHTFDSDLAIFIIAPSGEVLELSTQNGGGQDNYQVTVFKDNTALFITSGAPPFNGTFRPEGRLINTGPPFPNTNPLGTHTFVNTFNGVNADGDWTMFINDFVAADVGTLNAWSITFGTGGPAPTVSLGPDITICPGQTATLTPIVTPSADTYVWSTGSTNSTINVSPVVTTNYSVTITTNGCTAADTIQVFVNPGGVMANAGPDLSVCQGTSTTLTGSGGGSGATYNWSTGQSGTSITVTPSSTTTYTLTVSNGGCSATDQVVVTVNPIPAADAGPPVTICDGQSATLTATGGFQNTHYLWSTGQTGSTIIVSPVNTTIYTVTVTINGCSASDNVQVTVNPTPTVDAGPNVQICAGESTNLSATGTGTSYLWSTGQSGANITVSPAGTTTYTVTANDNGCTATDNVTVTVGNITAGISPNQTICEGSTIVLVATGGNTYEWSTGESGSSISVTPSNTTSYTVTATQGSCTDEATVTITVNPVPTATVSPDEEICEGETVTLTASGGSTYHWSSGQNTSSINVSPVNTTNYVVTVSSNGCSATASVEVVVHPTPVANAGSNEEICNGESVILLATGLQGTGTYEWSNGETGPSINVSPSVTTNYLVTVTNEWNCFDVDAVTVTVNPVPVANAGPDIDLCNGSSATLIASGGSSPSTYHWSTGENGSTIIVEPNTNTTYTVTVTISGCSSVDETEVNVLTSPNAFAGLDEEVCEGNSATLTATGGGTYEWSNGQNNQTINVTPPITTIYTITVTSNNGCTDIDNVSVIVFANPIADAGPDQSICDGESATLSGSGGTNYFWSTSEGLQNITVTPPASTSYSLTVTDANGCSNTDIVNVAVNPFPIANAGFNVFINSGETATLIATGGGSYLWSTGETTSQIMVSPGATTTYTVTVTVNGCSDVDDVIVFVDQAPFVDLGTDLVICEGETAIIDATIAGPFTIGYIWSTGETTSTINVTPSVTTSYSVTATETTSGFSSVDTVTVTVLTLPIGIPVIDGSFVLCQNDIADYNVNSLVGATSYTWSVPPGATIVSGQGTTSVQVNWGMSSGGQIQVVVSNSCGSIPASLADVILNTPPVIIGPVNGQIDPCEDGSGTYSIAQVSGADTYQWTITGGGSIVSGQGTTNLTINWNGSSGGDLCVVASNQCGNSIPECLTIVTTNTPSLSAGPDQVICGLTGSLNGSGSGAWSLVTGPGAAQFSDINDPASALQVSLPGQYVLQYSYSQNGCFAEDDVNVLFNENPMIINEINDCNNINTAYTVSFEISGGQAPYLINGIPFGGGVFNSGPIVSGDPYSFQVTDAKGCLSEELTGNVICFCSTQAGLMDPTPIDGCVDAKVTATYNGGAIVDGNDKIAFILYDGNIPGGIIAWNVIPEFKFMPPMQTETVYFISAVVGDGDPGGLPLLSDPCLAISPGTPVIFHDLPNANAGQDKILGCNPDKVAIDANGSSSGQNIQYDWTTIGGSIDGPSNAFQINASSGGLYILTVSNIQTGCDDFDTVEVVSKQLSIDNLQLESIPPLCIGDCNGIIQINPSQNGLVYDFGDGNFTADPVFNSACSGVSNIAVMDTLGCVRDTMIFVDTPAPVEVSLGPDQLITFGDSVTLSAESASNVIDYNWFSASGCTSCNQIIVTPSASSTYVVEITDINQCTAIDSVDIVLKVSNEVFIPDIFSPNGDGINDVFLISGGHDLQSIQFMEIYDRWGNLVFHRNNITPGDPTQGWNGTFKGSRVNPGVFVYKIYVTFLSGNTAQYVGDVTIIK